MNLCADRLLAVLEIDAIQEELKLLREQYFFEPQHSDFNAFYYEYLEKVNRDGLSLEERLEISYKAYIKAIDYMNTFYPTNRMDVELLSFNSDWPFYPDVPIKFPKKNLLGTSHKKGAKKGGKRKPRRTNKRA